MPTEAEFRERYIRVGIDGVPQLNVAPGTHLVCGCGKKVKLKRRSRDVCVAECSGCGRECETVTRKANP